MSRPIRYGQLRSRSLVRLILLVVLAVAVAAVAGCGGSASTPQTTLAHYLDDWGRGDWAAMRSEVLNPPADFTSVNSQAFSALGISHASFGAGPVAMARSSDSASAQVSERFTLPHVGAWDSTTTVRMVKHDKDWLRQLVAGDDQPVVEGRREARGADDMAVSGADPGGRWQAADEQAPSCRRRCRRSADAGRERGAG